MIMASPSPALELTVYRRNITALPGERQLLLLVDKRASLACLAIPLFDISTVAILQCSLISGAWCTRERQRRVRNTTTDNRRDPGRRQEQPYGAKQSTHDAWGQAPGGSGRRGHA